MLELGSHISYRHECGHLVSGAVTSSRSVIHSKACLICIALDEPVTVLKRSFDGIETQWPLHPLDTLLELT